MGYYCIKIDFLGQISPELLQSNHLFWGTPCTVLDWVVYKPGEFGPGEYEDLGFLRIKVA